MRKIGITTTVPSEIIFAAGAIPVDLNNIFITDPHPEKYVDMAEIDGYPRNICGWIKGIYGAILKNDIREVIAVTQGDCSNTHALMETLQLKGISSFPFAYPYDRDENFLKMQFSKMLEYFNVTWDEALIWHKKLYDVRKMVWELDRLTWETNQATGFENHYYQVCCSDFNGDPNVFLSEVTAAVEEIKVRKPFEKGVRLGFIGVPPIFTDFYEYIEQSGARVVFNEVQRQFSMPFPKAKLLEQYLLYTYPYHAFVRIKDIEREIHKRQLDGIIHYTQSFCFRQIEDIIYRQKLNLPILTLEGDRPGKLDARTKMRIDTFIEMLR